MKLRMALLAIAAALGAASCGETSTPPGQTANPPLARQEGATTPDRAVTPVVARGNPTPAAPRIQEDAPPRDARYTLFCDVIRGPDHVIRAAQIKSQLIQTTGLGGWHLIHAEEQSTLFFGYYRTFDDKKNDPAEFARTQADLHRISDMRNGQGDAMFKGTMFLPLNDPDPEAPPQWDLAKTPANAYWSLQIAAYRGIPERKQAAVDAVRQARAMGVEAYYYHGETISSVCIGAWPIDAVKRQEASSGGGLGSSSDTLLIVGSPLPPNTDPNVVDREGNKLQVQAPKLEILDPSMARAIQKYPEHAVNNQVMVRRAKDGRDIPSPSFLVLIPHPEGPTPTSPDGDGIRNGTAINNGADQAAHDILDNPTPGRGRLRSLDQK